MSINEPQEFSEEHNSWKDEVSTTDPMIDYKTVWEMRKLTGSGKIKRQFTFTEKYDNALLDFLQTHTGTEPKRGKGISSAIVELFIRLCLAIVTGFEIDEAVNELNEIIVSPLAKQRIKENLQEIERKL